MPHQPGHVFDPYNLSPEEEKSRRLLRQAEDALAPAAMRGQLGERGPLQEFLIEQADEIKNITGAKRARITDPDAFGSFLAGRSTEFEEFTGRPSPMRQAMTDQQEFERPSSVEGGILGRLGEIGSDFVRQQATQLAGVPGPQGLLSSAALGRLPFVDSPSPGEAFTAATTPVVRPEDVRFLPDQYGIRRIGEAATHLTSPAELGFTGLTAGAGPAIVGGIGGTGIASRAARLALEPIVSGGLPSRIAAETAAGVGGVLGAEELMKRAPDNTAAQIGAGLLGGLGGGVAGVAGVRGTQRAARAVPGALRAVGDAIAPRAVVNAATDPPLGAADDVTGGAVVPDGSRQIVLRTEPSQLDPRDATIDELTEAIAKAKDDEHGKLVRAFGSEEEALRFERLDRRQDSQILSRTQQNAASRELEEMLEITLPDGTKVDRFEPGGIEDKLIYGHVSEPELTEESLRSLKSALLSATDEDTATVFRTLTARLIKLNKSDIEELINATRQEVASSRLGTVAENVAAVRAAYGSLLERGLSRADIEGGIQAGLRAQGIEDIDIEFLMRDFVGNSGRPALTPPTAPVRQLPPATPATPPVRAADAPLGATPYKDYFDSRAAARRAASEGDAEAARRAAVDAEIDALPPQDGGIRMESPAIRAEREAAERVPAERDEAGRLVGLPENRLDPSFGAVQGGLLDDIRTGPVIPSGKPLVRSGPPDHPRPGTPLLDGMEKPVLDPNNPIGLESEPLPGLRKRDTFRNQAIRMGQAVKLPLMRLRDRVGVVVDRQIRKTDRIIRAEAAVFGEMRGGQITEAFPDLDDAGRIPSLAGIDSRVPGAPHWTDIGPRFPIYEPHLTPAQRAAYIELREALVPWREMLRQLGVELDSRADVMIRGGFYIPRTPDVKEMRAVLNISDPIVLRDLLSPEAAQARVSFEHAATFESAALGIDEAGIKYLLPDDGLESYIQDVGRKSTKAWVANFAANALDETGYPIARPHAQGAKRTVAVIDEAGQVVGSTDVRVSAGERGRIILPKTNLAEISSYDFPSEMADAVNAALDNPSQYIGKLPGPREIAAFNRLWRSFKSTLDDSGLGIQAWPLLASHPWEIPGVLRLNANAMRNPRLFQAWMRSMDAQMAREGGISIEEMARNGLDLGARTEFNFRNEGLEGVIARIPGVRRADSTFSQTGRGNRIKWARIFLRDELQGYSLFGKEVVPFGRRSLDDIRSSGDLGRIMEIANNVSGSATGRFGGAYGDWLLFAPRFLQSRFETILKGVAGMRPGAPLNHRLARRTVLQMIGLMTTTTWLINEQRGKDTDFRPIVNGRYNPNFIRVMDVAGRDISLFGPFDSIAALMVNVGIAVQGGDPTKIPSAFRGFTSGTVGQTWDLVMQEDFLGRPITNNWERLVHFARSIVPFSGNEAQQLGAEGISAGREGDVRGVRDAAIGGVLEATGIRTTERGIGDILNAAAREQYPQQTAAASGRFGTVAADPYDLLESYEKKDLRESLGAQLDPRISNRQDDQSRYFREIDSITEERLGREADIVAQVAAGTMSKDVAKDNYGEAQSEAAIRRKQAAKDFGIEFEEQSLDESEGNKLALQQYYDLMEPGRPSGGTPVVNKAGNFMGWEVWDAEMVKLTNKWRAAGTLDYVLRNIRDSEHAEGMLARGAGQILSTATLDRIAASDKARSDHGGAAPTAPGQPVVPQQPAAPRKLIEYPAY